MEQLNDTFFLQVAEEIGELLLGALSLLHC